MEKGNRSDALTRLAYECVEAGLSNEESYVLLEDRDSVWGKYVNRSDRQKRLESFISYVRSKKADTQELVHDTANVYKFHDFMHTNVRMNWAVQDLLPVAGSMVIFGKAGIGKSTFALRLGMSLALGKEKFINWKIVNRQRVLFVSLEMQHGELKQFFTDMQISEEDQQQLQDWFYVWPIGHAYPLDTPDQQIELLKYIDKNKIDLVIVDSLGLSMYGSVKDDDAVKRLNSFLNEDVRKERKCGYLFIHHPRKQGVDEGKKVVEQDDVYGSAYIVFNAQTIMLLSQKAGSNRLNVKMLKTRMVQGSKDFDIERTPDRGFKLVDRTSSESRETPPVQTGNAPIFGKLSNI